MKTQRKIEAKLRDLEYRLEHGRMDPRYLSREDEGCLMTLVHALSWVLEMKSSEELNGEDFLVNDFI